MAIHISKINTDLSREKMATFNSLLTEFESKIKSISEQIYLYQVIDKTYDINKKLDEMINYLQAQSYTINTASELLGLDFDKLLASRHELKKDLAYSNNANPKRFMWEIPACWYKGSGVYFLWENEELVYIGQSENCVNRIIQHKNSTDKKGFTHASVFHMQIDTSKHLERILIKHFKPKYNVRFK